MYEIMGIQGDLVFLRTPEGGFMNIPFACISYQNPNIGDRVSVLWDGQSMIVSLVQSAQPMMAQMPVMQQPMYQQPMQAMQQYGQQFSGFAQQPAQHISHRAMEQAVERAVKETLEKTMHPVVENAIERAAARAAEQAVKQAIATSPAPAQQVSSGQSTALAQTPTGSNVKVWNKHIYTWVFNFLLGYIGVDRFLRGQIPLGIVKFLTGGGLGIWYLIDWIIAISKSYGGPFKDTEELVFIDGQYAR